MGTVTKIDASLQPQNPFEDFDVREELERQLDDQPPEAGPGRMLVHGWPVG
jgi:hypothetical protein